MTLHAPAADMLDLSFCLIAVWRRAAQEWRSATTDRAMARLKQTMTALLGHEGQKILWMSDHDAICANAAAHNRLLALFNHVLGLYTSKQFSRLGGVLPFRERSTDFLDLLSDADIVAGTLAQYFTERNAVGEQNACVKEGVDKVLVWLGHDGLGLKKFCIQIILGDDGTICSGAVEFAPKQTPQGVTFLPIHLCR
jgi:hypothetical protein